MYFDIFTIHSPAVCMLQETTVPFGPEELAFHHVDGLASMLEYELSPDPCGDPDGVAKERKQLETACYAMRSFKCRDRKSTLGMDRPPDCLDHIHKRTHQRIFRVMAFLGLSQELVALCQPVTAHSRTCQRKNGVTGT